MVAGMEKTRGRATGEVLGKNSQVARLRKIVKQTKGSLVLGVILLLLLFLPVSVTQWYPMNSLRARCI